MWRAVEPWRSDCWWVFFLGSQISDTHLPHVLIRTPICTISIGNLNSSGDDAMNQNIIEETNCILSRSSLTLTHRTWSTNKISVSVSRRRRRRRRSNGSVKEAIETVLFFFYNSITQALSKPHNLSSFKKFKPYPFDSCYVMFWW